MIRLKISKLNYKIAQNHIIKDFNLTLTQGEIITLFGASGCGKSTLLRCVANILKPESGVIKSEKSAFVFQENALFENLNAFENIALTMPKPDKKWILDQSRLFLLDEKDMFKYPSQLSGGMCARVAFIRALAYNTSLFLLDEPFSGLDFSVKKILAQKLIEKVKTQQASALLVTHDAFEACLLSDKIYFLKPKFMQLEKTLCIEKDFEKRDENFINALLKEHFKERIYFE